MATRPKKQPHELSESYRIRSSYPGFAYQNKAHQAVQRALASGKLLRQPCEQCGAPKTHAHHADYSKPLEVQWLCPLCHKAVHRKTHCIHGHALTDDNIRINSNGLRTCRTCYIEQTRKGYQRKREQLLQMQNTRGTRLITFNGQTMSLNAWAKQIGINKESLRLRLSNWPLELAMTKPAKNDHRRTGAPNEN